MAQCATDLSDRLQRLTVQELNILAYDLGEAIYSRFSPSQTISEQVQILMQFIHPDKLDDLCRQLDCERSVTNKPFRFEASCIVKVITPLGEIEVSGPGYDVERISQILIKQLLVDDASKTF